LAGRLPSGTGRKLYGYDYLKGKGLGEGVRYINENEAKWVQEMYRWLIEEGLTINGITRRAEVIRYTHTCLQPVLAQAECPPDVNQCRLYRKDVRFTREYVQPETRFKTTTGNRKTGVVRKPKDQWVLIPNATPAIISEKTFEAAQEILKRNKELSCRNAKRSYLLSGFIYCQRCGVRYQGQIRKWKDNGKRHEQRYYRCSKSQRSFHPVTCDNGAINGPRIEKPFGKQWKIY